MNTSVLQPWVCNLNFMQQSVLIASIRGPDGIQKDHVAKVLLRWFRRCVLFSAFESKIKGRPSYFSDPYQGGGGSFTGPQKAPLWWNPKNSIVSNDCLLDEVNQYLRSVDELPHHFQLHFMHAAEIVGYLHPVEPIRSWWNLFYNRLVKDAHLNPETKEQMMKRLGDNEQDWRAAEEVVAK